MADEGLWLVTKWWSYEGEEPIGVFTTLDKAHEHIKQESPSGKPLVPAKTNNAESECWSFGSEETASWGWTLRLVFPDHPERTAF